MQRPIMDPLFLQDDPEPPTQHSAMLGGLPRAALRGIGWIVEKLFSNPLRGRGSRTPPDDEGAWSRLVREMTSRLVFLPLLLALSAAVLVYSGTHPPTPPPGAGPTAVGLYYESVDFTSEDGLRLRGWLIPAIDARLVLEGDGKVLGGRHPGAVLAHDYGQSPSQFLPLLGPLHESGFDIFVVGLRGVGLGRPMAQTFGSNESKDIAAAVQLLKGYPTVDPSRIAVLGVGTGANAALLANERNPGIAALVLADPLADTREAVKRYIGPNYWALEWMQNVSLWALEIGCRIGPGEIDSERFGSVLADEKTFREDDVGDTSGNLAPEFVRRATQFIAERALRKEHSGQSEE